MWASNGLEDGRAVLAPEIYRRVKHIVTENQRVLDTVEMLEDQGPAAIGELLSASHASMRDDFGISSVELDLAVDSAMAAGALGARMTGGGFGGSAIALVADRDAEAVRAAVRRGTSPWRATSPRKYFPWFPVPGRGDC